jgi:hypothetical protein
MRDRSLPCETDELAEFTNLRAARLAAVRKEIESGG